MIICRFVVMLGTISLDMVTDKDLARFLAQYFFLSCIILMLNSSKVSLVRSRTSSSCPFKKPISCKGRCPPVRGVEGGTSNGGSSPCHVPCSAVFLASPCSLSLVSFSLFLLSSSSCRLFSWSTSAYWLFSLSSIFFISFSNLLFSSSALSLCSSSYFLFFTSSRACLSSSCFLFFASSYTLLSSSSFLFFASSCTLLSSCCFSCSCFSFSCSSCHLVFPCWPWLLESWDLFYLLLSLPLNLFPFPFQGGVPLF